MPNRSGLEVARRDKFRPPVRVRSRASRKDHRVEHALRKIGEVLQRWILIDRHCKLTFVEERPNHFSGFTQAVRNLPARSCKPRRRWGLIAHGKFYGR